MKVKRKSRSARAGLVFPISRVRNQVKQTCSSRKMRIGWSASTYLTAVLEYVTAEVAELSGNVCCDNKRKRISPRDIMIAVRVDRELDKMLKNVVLPGAGTIPSIHAQCLSPRRKPKPPAPSKRKSTQKPPVSKQEQNLLLNPNKTSRKKRVKGKKEANHGVTVLDERVLQCGVKLTVASGDITQLPCNAVVIPSSANFGLGGQVATHINTVSSGALQKAVTTAQNTTINPGEAAFLKCGKMKECNFDSALFCNGPSWNNTAADIILLEETVKSCLIAAQENGMKSIAFPAIGSGRGNFPKQPAIATILCAMSIYLNSEKHNLTHVTFVLHDPESIQIYVSELARLQE